MSYSYKRSITIDHTKVPNTDQSNFPMLVSITDATLKTAANGGHVQNSNGYDIGFFSDSALTTALYWEMERYTASTGEVIAWVKIPTLSHTSDTVIYMAYGDSGISTFQSTAWMVWGANFKGVWHLGENAANTTVADSSGTGNTGTNQANTSAKTAAGKVGNGLTFNGSSDWVSIGSSASLGSGLGSFTISAWVKKSSNSTVDAIVWHGDDSDGSGASYRFLTLTTGQIQYLVGDWNTGKNFKGSTIADTNWHYVTMTYDGTTLRGYYEGIADGSASSGTYTAADKVTRIGSAQTSGASNYYAHAVIDEVRIANVARSGDWIATEYNNQNSPGTFFTLGPETALGGTTYSDSLSLGITAAASLTGGLALSSSASFGATAAMSQTPGAAFAGSVALGASAAMAQVPGAAFAGSVALGATAAMAQLPAASFASSASFSTTAAMGLSVNAYPCRVINRQRANDEACNRVTILGAYAGTNGAELRGVANDTADQTAKGRVIEVVLPMRELETQAAVDLAASAELLRRAPTETINIEWDHGLPGAPSAILESGMLLSLRADAEGINGSFVIQQLSFRQASPTWTIFQAQLGDYRGDLAQRLRQLARLTKVTITPAPPPPDGSVTTDKLADSAVTSLKLAAAAVTEAKIAVGAITTAIMAAGAVTTTIIADNAISTPKLQAGSVVSATLATGSVVAGKVAANAIVGSNIQAGSITAGNAVFAAAAIAAADIGSVNASVITTGTLSADRIATGSLTGPKLADGTITAVKIASIDASTITTGYLNAARIQTASISGAVLLDGSVPSVKIDSLAAEKIAAGTITVGSGSITIQGTSATNQFKIINSSDGSRNASLGYNYLKIIDLTAGATMELAGPSATGVVAVANTTPYVNLIGVSGSGEYRIGGTNVVKARQSGWTAWTGTATKTSVATGSATTQNCAEAVKAIIDLLIYHGLAG